MSARLFMKRLAVTLAVVFLAAPVALAAAWKAEGPYYGNITSIALDPASPERLWVSTNGGGVWRSLDGGKSWALSGKLLSDRSVSFVLLQPKSNTLWAGAEQGALARSRDGGQTWEWVMTDLAVTPHPVVFDPNNPKAIWLPDVNLHKKSADGGTKWSEFRISGGDAMTFSFHPKDSKTIWAGGVNGRSGLWRTSDGGASWKQLGTGLAEMNRVQKIVVDPSTPDTLYMAASRGGYRSTDGGASWTPFGSSFPQSEEIEGLTMHPSSPETLYAGTRKGLWKTTDGGQTWSRLTGGLPRYIVRGLAIHPTTPDVMWAAAAGAGVYKTTDGGKSWTEANGGLAASWIDNVWGNAAGMIFAQTGRGLFRSDGKGGWVEVLQPFSNDKASLDTILFDPKNPKTLHAGYASSYYRSTDGGMTWSRVSESFQDPSPSFGCVALDAKNAKVLYSAAKYPSSNDPSIFKSVDGGVKWKPSGRGVTGGILSLISLPSGTLVALGKDGGVWRSADGATTWTKGGEGLPSKDVAGLAASETAIYVAAKDGLFRSDDGGATFTKSDKRALRAVAVDTKGNVYIASDESVARSTDGAKTFSAMSDGLTNADVRSLSTSGSRLYAGTAGGGVFSIDLP
jgi:photosystem II stability/assembly factor-like uncharacterized protein